MSWGIPMPDSEPLSVEVTACEACGATHGTRPFRCEACGGDALSTKALPGLGKLFTWTVVRRPPDAFAEFGPMTVALVDIDSGPRMTVSLETDDVEPPLGARVKVTGFRNGVPHCVVE